MKSASGGASNVLRRGDCFGDSVSAQIQGRNLGDAHGKHKHCAVIQPERPRITLKCPNPTESRHESPRPPTRPSPPPPPHLPHTSPPRSSEAQSTGGVRAAYAKPTPKITSKQAKTDTKRPPNKKRQGPKGSCGKKETKGWGGQTPDVNGEGADLGELGAASAAHGFGRLGTVVQPVSNDMSFVLRRGGKQSMLWRWSEAEGRRVHSGWGWGW